jgi:DNA topoisomerase-2
VLGYSAARTVEQRFSSTDIIMAAVLVLACVENGLRRALLSTFALLTQNRQWRRRGPSPAAARRLSEAPQRRHRRWHKKRPAAARCDTPPHPSRRHTHNAAAAGRSGPAPAAAQRLGTPPQRAAPQRAAARSHTPPAPTQTRNTPTQGDATNSPPPKAPKARKKGAKTIEQTYQKKTQLEHILLRPDTYVGSIEQSTQPMWVLDAKTKRIVKKQTTYVPGLFKIFDEIMVNAADNKQRDPSMTTIKVDIDRETNTISVANDGKGIPVQIHSEHNCYVPELIFGHLLTGSNFDDDEKKTTGGRNGYGAKLANIFSTSFTVETADSSTGKKLKQTWVNNMSKTVGEAQISTHKGKKDFTRVSFTPDLKRFKMDSLDDDVVGLLSRRAYDVAASSSCHGNGSLKVELNGERVPVKSFAQYVKLHDGLEPPAALEKLDDNWTVGVAPSDGTFTQLSFVNSICTSKGGQHVDAVAKKVCVFLAKAVKKKNKGQEVKPAFIKAHLCVYVDALIVNPAFDSQTKETLTTKERSFGSKVSLPEKFLKAIEKSGVVDRVLAWTKFKQDEQLKRKGGSKKMRLTGITKLDDANSAGGAKGKDCTLILTEGDSAKALAVSGLGVVGRDLYGVFPLKGKPLNVREASHAAIMKNEEVRFAASGPSRAQIGDPGLNSSEGSPLSSAGECRSGTPSAPTHRSRTSSKFWASASARSIPRKISRR